MGKLFVLFFRICQMRLGPQDVPASSSLLVVMLPVYVAINTVVISPLFTLSQLVGIAIIDSLLLMGLPAVLLWVTSKVDRYFQTQTALLGCSTIIAMCSSPFVLIQAGTDPENPLIFASVALLLMAVWNIVVMGHIITAALGISRIVGCALAVFYWYISYAILSRVFLNPVAS